MIWADEGEVRETWVVIAVVDVSSLVVEQTTWDRISEVRIIVGDGVPWCSVDK